MRDTDRLREGSHQTDERSQRHRIADSLTHRRTRRILLIGFLVVTLFVGSGIQSVQVSTSLSEFRKGTEANAAGAYVDANLSAVGANTTTGHAVVQSDQNVLTKKQYLAQLRAQQALLRNETVAPTLAADRRPIGLANVVGTIAVREAGGQSIRNISATPQPPLSEQISHLKSVPPWRVKLFTSYAVGVVLDDVDHRWPPGGAFAFVPVTYEPAQKSANTTAVVVTYDDRVDPKRLSKAQHATAAIFNRHLDRGSAWVVGDGTINQELRQSSVDSLRLVGPFSLLLVLAVLTLTYRNGRDTFLGMLGVVLVLVWTFGMMGWLGIKFTQLLVVVPALLVGLSIDYGIHILTRYRTWRQRDGAAPQDAMTNALAGVSLAIILVTITTVIGFLSMLTSGVGPIRQFGLVSAIGISVALIVFGIIVPALKLEVATHGREPERSHSTSRASQTRGPGYADSGRVRKLLNATAARGATRAPRVILGVALITALAGGYLATDLQTSFEEDDLLVDGTPQWMESLPAPLEPADYEMEEHIDYMERTGYVSSGTTTNVLVRGNLTDRRTLERVATATARANRSRVVLRLPNEQPAARGPVMAMRDVAAQNASFRTTFRQADQDGDGVPDQNLGRVYSEFFRVAPDVAQTMIYRRQGEYQALRITVPVKGEASEQRVTATVRSLADGLEGGGLTATATGRPVENQVVAQQLRRTMLETLVLTLAVVLTLLSLVYRTTAARSTIGIVVVLPVVLVLSWVFGSMAVLGIPFNVMTAVITGLTIGMGVDYSIHATERYLGELERTGSVEQALQASVVDTGRALASSAATTASGFGLLAVAIMTPLKLFGILAALTIIYSFLASVVVLPSLLVLWTGRTSA